MAKYDYIAIRVDKRFGPHFVLLTENPAAGWRVRDYEDAPPVLPQGPGHLPGASPALLRREADRVIPVEPHPADDWRWWRARLRELQRSHPMAPDAGTNAPQVGGPTAPAERGTVEALPRRGQAEGASHRWLIFAPEVNPATFVFFYFRGTSGRSWSVRDYLGLGPSVRYAGDFPPSWTPEAILHMAGREGCFAQPAPTVDTNDIAFWRALIGKLNRQHLGIAPAAAPQEARAGLPLPHFPLLDADQLLRLPKARKREDMQRILSSARSEDYVTWNTARLLARAGAGDWWPRLAGLAAAQAGPQGLDATDLPDLRLWHLVPSPRRYEQASRDRMRNADNPYWRTRAGIADPVEGPSEIDLTLSARTYLVFVEAKLDSDVSPRTTYDPARNQILRNIDCLLEEAGGRIPRFWMLAKDRHLTRAYVQLLADYRQDPAGACALLPHRDPRQVREVVRHAAVITWVEALGLLPAQPAAGPEEAVLGELRRRVSG